MPSGLLKLGRYLLIAAMFAACGGHWLVLQSVAWGGMLVHYSRDAGLTVAVEKTFDGHHPCGLCKKIEKEQGSQRERAPQVVLAKLELFYAENSPYVLPARPASELETTDCKFGLRAQAPSVPPPRNA